MFAIETLRKVMGLARAARKKYEEMRTEDIKLCISKGNKKIGRVMNVSLMPIMTCPNCSGCSKLCYDIKACSQYPNTVIDARMRNTVLMERDMGEYFARIDAAISRRRKNKYFRWHVAGDIKNIEYFDHMIEIARRHPDFIFWTYTKNYAVVNAYVQNHGGSIAAAIPSNLSVMFSEWRGMDMVNPFGFPEFRVVFKDEVEPAGFYCPGNCDVCKAAHRGCLASETTYCREH